MYFHVKITKILKYYLSVYLEITKILFAWFLMADSARGYDSVSADLKILSRSKLIDGRLHESRPVVLNAAQLRNYFSYPLNVAAREFGLCPTALKR